jgi:hypothetical protein
VVRLVRTEGGGLRGEITLPEGLTGVFEWGGKTIARTRAARRYRCELRPVRGSHTYRIAKRGKTRKI